MAASTSWNALNYVGELFLIGAQASNSPFTSMIGGVNSGATYQDVRFPTAQPWALGSATQPAITETASLTAPTANTVARGQDFNTTQIFQEQVSVSYVAEAQRLRLAAGGLATLAAGDNPVMSEFDFQLEAALKLIYKKLNFTFLNGVYAAATAANVAAKSRGILTATTTNAVAAGAAALDKAILDSLFLAMATGGAQFSNTVIYATAKDVQRINDIYAFAPADRNVGGTNVKTINAPFIGTVGVVWDNQIPEGSLLCADLSVCKPVFTPTPGKGLLFYEELAKTGAGTSGQMFGMIGLDYGPEEYHGKITGLAA